MNSYKQINESWQKFIKEQEQEPKVDKPFDSEHAELLAAANAAPGTEHIKVLDPKVRDWIQSNVERLARDFAQKKVEEGDFLSLASYKEELLTRSPRTFFSFFDEHGHPISLRIEDFIDRAPGNNVEWSDNPEHHPSGYVPDEDYAVGAVFAYSVVIAAEKLLGRPIDVQLLAATVPEVADDLEAQGIEPIELDIEDFKAISMYDQEKEKPTESEPLPDPMPPSDSEPAAPKAAPEPKPEPEAPASPDDDEGEITLPEPEMAIAGINSEVYGDSLINMLKNSGLAKALSREQISQLLSFMLQATEQDDIVLEAIGDPERAPRTYSPETTRQLNDLINSFNLSSEVNQKLEKLIKKWAKLNTVKFSPPAPKPEPTPGEDEDTSDEPTETGTARSAEDGEDKEELSTLGKLELGIEAALNTVSAAGINPAFEATLIPSAATLGSLVFNLVRGKMSAALLDIIALAPVVGKASKLGKLGPIGAKLAAKVGPASFKGGRLLIKTFGSAKNAKAAITTMKSAKAAKDLAKAGSATKELIENVPEEWISAAIYKKQDDGDYWIDTVLGGVEKLASVPGIPDSIGASANELKQSVDKLRRAIPAPRESKPEPSELTESFERLQTLAGIKKRKL